MRDEPTKVDVALTLAALLAVVAIFVPFTAGVSPLLAPSDKYTRPYV